MITPNGSSLENSALSALRRSRQLEQQSLERLASGRKINRGSDDPAGLIALTKLDSAIEALRAESELNSRLDANANIADGALTPFTELTSELRGLLVKSGNTGALSDDEIAANQLEIDSIVSSLERFTHGASKSLSSLGLPADEAQAAVARLEDAVASISTLKSGGANSLASGNLEDAAEVLETAGTAFAELRGQVGSYQRYTLQAEQRAREIQEENLSQSRSVIGDTDYAEEAVNLSRAQVLTTSAISMLKVAKQNNAAVLALLR